MSKLRLIQCGVGGHGKGWIINTTSKSPDFDLVAIVDVVDKQLQESGDAAGVSPDKRFKTLEEALDKVQADAVLTVTPPAVHVQHAKLAFARGLHLLTEKPLADNLANAKLMLQYAREANKQLVVSQNYRYAPFIQKLRQMIAGKELGEFGHGHLDFYIPADFTGTFREKMPYVLLVDMAIHHLDLIRAVTGRNIVKVYAKAFNPAWSWYQHGAALKMLLELEGGTYFTYSGDWSGKGRNTTWSGSWRLQCAEGSLNVENDKIAKWLSPRGWQGGPSETAIDAGQLSDYGLVNTLTTFAEAIRSGKPAQISGQDNIWSFGAVMAGVQSSETGQTVDVKELVS